MYSFAALKAYLERLSPFGWRVYTDLRRLNVSFMASSMAYQAFMSLLPLFVVLYLLVAMVAGDRLAAEVLELTEAILPTETRRLLATAIGKQVTTTATSLVSLTVLLWGAIGLFRTFQTAFATIYETTTKSKTVHQVLDALLTFGIILIATIGAAVAATVSAFVRVPFANLVSSAFLFGGLTIAFLPMYYLFPNTSISLKSALPGALIAAVGWTVLQWVFQLYLQYVSSPSVSGALGTILVLLTWLYYGSYVILFGAVTNASLSGRDSESKDSDST